MDTLQIDKINEVELRIQCDLAQMMELKEFSSFMAPNYLFHPSFRAKIWNGKLSWFNTKEKTVPIGLLPELIKFCEQYKYQPKLNFDVKELTSEPVDDDLLNKFYEHIFARTEFRPRDYQHDAISSALNNRRGVIKSATGSGKSLIIYSIVRFLLAEKKNIILVVPNVSLVNQIFSDFVEYGWYEVADFTEKLYSGQKPSFDKPILITTYQSLMKRPESFFTRFDAIINDEAHSVKSVELQKVSKKCMNATTRIGLTATLPKADCDKFNIQGMLGPVIFNLKSKKLIDRGVLSKIKVVNTFLKYPEEIDILGRNRQYQDEVSLIQDSPERQHVFKYIFDNMPDKQNSIILVQNIKHLELISDYIEKEVDEKFKLYVVHGGVKADIRENIRKLVELEDNVILLATYGTLSTGVNLKRVHNLILGSSSKSEIRILQSIGRGLRTHESKDGVIIWDLIDDFTYDNRNKRLVKNHVYKHWEERYKYYTEQEFPCLKKTIKL